MITNYNMLLKLTKKAETGRLIRGINLNEIEETIAKGIKTKQKEGILTNNNNTLVLFSKINDLHIIKMVTLK